MKKYWPWAIAILVAAGLAISFLGAHGVPDGRPKHLIVLVLDSARPDHMSVYGYPKPTTPFLQSQARQMIVFDRAKTAAPWTVPSHATIFTGLWPSEHRSNWGNVHLAEERETLAEILANKGFFTIGLSCNPFVRKRYGFAQGFKAFRYVNSNHRSGAERVIERLDGWLGEIANKKRRLFVFVNLMDAHIPYNSSQYRLQFGATRQDPVTNHGKKWQINAGEIPFADSDRAEHMAAYDASIRFLDDAVQRLFGILQRYQMLEDSIVVVTSDHGEGLGAHGNLGHELTAWEEQLAVPLMVRLPHGAQGGKRVGALTSLTGLVPQVLDWLDVERPAALARRPGLLDFPPDAVTAEYRSYYGDTEVAVNKYMTDRHPDLAARDQHLHVVYCDSYKLYVRADGTRMFFDLAADPGETRDLAATNSPALLKCVRRYAELARQNRFIPFSERVLIPEGGAPTDKTDLETLKSLGYLE